MTTGRIILGSRLASLLIDTFNLILIGFLTGLGLFSQIQDGFRYCYSLENPKKLEIFKNGKMLIKIQNYHKGSGKPRKFSRSHMTKRTTSLNSSREI